ncbi:MAG: hypothetical protein ACOYWZ_09555 [Bacillota bacterium]
MAKFFRKLEKGIKKVAKKGEKLVKKAAKNKIVRGIAGAALLSSTLGLGLGGKLLGAMGKAGKALGIAKAGKTAAIAGKAGKALKIAKAGKIAAAAGKAGKLAKIAKTASTISKFLPAISVGAELIGGRQARKAEERFRKEQTGLQREQLGLEKELGESRLGLEREQQGLERELGTGRLGLEKERLGLERELGTGRLGLEERQLGLERELGTGRLGLERERFGLEKAMVPFQQAQAERQLELAQLGRMGELEAARFGRGQALAQAQAAQQYLLPEPQQSVLVNPLVQEAMRQTQGALQQAGMATAGMGGIRAQEASLRALAPVVQQREQLDLQRRMALAQMAAPANWQERALPELNYRLPRISI